MTQILLVGAGAIGLTLACELRRHGVEVRVIDKREGPEESGEPLVFSPQAQDSLEQMGLAEIILESSHLIRGVSMHLSQSSVVQLPFQESQAVRTAPRALVEGRLREELQRRGVEVEWSTEVLDLIQGANSVSVLLQKQSEEEVDPEYDEVEESEKIEFHTTWVLACDQDGESLRAYLGLESETAEEPTAWSYADLRLKTPMPQDQANLYLNENGPLFSLSTGGENVFIRANVAASPVDQETAEEPEQGQTETPDLKAEIRQLIRQRVAKEQDVLQFISLGTYSFLERNLDDYRLGKVLFIGSAACNSSRWHLDETSAGIEDARNLAWKLALVSKGTGIEHILLDSFSTERRGVNQKHLDTKRGVELALTTSNPKLAKLRNTFLPFIFKLGFMRRRFEENIFSAKGTYDSSLLNYVGEGVSGKGLRPGSVLPNLTLRASNGELLDLYSLFQGPEHLLFLFGNADKYREVKEATERAFRGLLRAYLVEGNDGSGNPHADLVDTSNDFVSTFGLQAPFCVAVRPDAYVAYLGLGYSRARLLAHLGSYLQFQEEV